MSPEHKMIACIFGRPEYKDSSLIYLDELPGEVKFVEEINEFIMENLDLNFDA